VINICVNLSMSAKVTARKVQLRITLRQSEIQAAMAGVGVSLVVSFASVAELVRRGAVAGDRLFHARR
jgi:hypothetical protein